MPVIERPLRGYSRLQRQGEGSEIIVMGLYAQDGDALSPEFILEWSADNPEACPKVHCKPEEAHVLKAFRDIIDLIAARDVLGWSLNRALYDIEQRNILNMDNPTDPRWDYRPIQE